ncbi:metal-dependent hydrolase [Desulfogranum marinum]|uniref:metal-dependent hydrolase n=1 Tax=Desulfogranum marinum TaxID=453220 RepID=UPI00196477D3|nr:metal-dependent hydrolase [Desulfogranum marinum]MBM9514831.1 metal-dependent hydrolase [Desulfogranum marinum]
MDSLTQAALGAAVGHLFWNKKLGNKALYLGAVGGTIPDLDIILYPLLDDVQRLYWHRGESHSIWFVLLGSMLTGWLLCKYFHRERLSLPSAVLGTLLIYATHILIDYFTVYGTQLLAPLSRTGFALGNFFILDPLFTLPLLLGCAIAAVAKSSLGVKANVAGLTLAACYMMWSFSIQAIADHTFRSALAKENVDITRQRTTAGPFTTFLWRHVAETKDGFLLAYWSIFDKPTPTIQFYHIPRQADLIKKITDSRTFTVVEWFSQGWWFAVDEGDNLIRVVDLRFNEIPSMHGQSHQKWDWPFAWKFDLQAPQEKSLFSILPDVDAPLHTLQLLTTRIRGGKNWYSTSGNIGTGAITYAERLQEPLKTQ